MEQHAVPRNISGFQFHLIGDMTLRQFAYLGGGALAAFIVYKISPLPAILTFALAGAVFFAGAAFAFLPINERPLDRWLLAFIKSILSPTQYVWHKQASLPDFLIRPISVRPKTLPPQHLAAHQDAKEKLRAYLKTLPATPHQTLNTREKSYIDHTLALFQTPGTMPNIPMTGMSSITIPPVAHIPPTPAIQPEFQVPKLQPIEASREKPTPVTQQTSPGSSTNPAPSPSPTSSQPSPQTAPHAAPQPNTVEYSALQKELIDLATEKENLLRELAALKQNPQTSQVIKPRPAQEEAKPTIKTVTPKAAVNELGMPSIPQTPNVVLGVIKDSQKKILPNIILTIKDAKEMPLRALKTNKLGQFLTATPLPSGTYYLEIEDPLKRYVFDIAEIKLTGTVFPPIEIDAKGEKELVREHLTNELFGNTV